MPSYPAYSSYASITFNPRCPHLTTMHTLALCSVHRILTPHPVHTGIGIENSHTLNTPHELTLTTHTFSVRHAHSPHAVHPYAIPSARLHSPCPTPHPTYVTPPAHSPLPCTLTCTVLLHRAQVQGSPLLMHAVHTHPCPIHTQPTHARSLHAPCPHPHLVHSHAEHIHSTPSVRLSHAMHVHRTLCTLLPCAHH